MINVNFNVSTQVSFVTEECCNCGVMFAVSKDLQGQWLKTKQSFYCPNGHPQSYSESEADRLKRQLAEAQRNADWQRQRAEKASKRAEQAEQATVKAQRATARLKKRVNCGVCPHCQRTFKQLAAHIQSKHAAEVAQS